ncbi:hypothetical protein SAMN02745857_00880 [Andreprevotia lacus DSM 23236]|uniref:Uncharacterized protein n=1 Tax=Andreprevotia lacus DSM 23236 TaxID=1121001 RepID=A0A1W1X8T0_9NEIS|nr:hypothetical protein [Andreprevotia lacus]SMC20234.1 hypothetical protein SAMN02745857_00880 [Andreprevotia lacus DSM 23236]
MLSLPFNPHAEAWLQAKGMQPPADEHPDWGFQLAASTVPLDDWLVRRSKLPPDALWFGLGFSRLLGWTATLQRRDEAFKVCWRPEHALEVEAQSMRYRHRTAWPALAALDALPQMLGALATLLDCRFLPVFQIKAASLKGSDIAVMADWLQPVASTLDFWVGKLHGELPLGALLDDEPAAREGCRFVLPLSIGR